MQMIADGKIKQGTKIKIVGRFCDKKEYYFEYKGYFEIYDGNAKRYDKDKWTGYISLYDLIHYSFEILEDKTKEIEEMTLNGRDIRFGSMRNWLGNCSLQEEKISSAIDSIGIKINELVKAVNKLNKQDTSKETNCMSE